MQLAYTESLVYYSVSSSYVFPGSVPLFPSDLVLIVPLPLSPASFSYTISLILAFYETNLISHPCANTEKPFQSTC